MLMNKRLLAGSFFALVLSGPGCRAGVEDRTEPLSQAMPWGPPVPRSLHSAALAYRQRALQHCVVSQVAGRAAGTVDQATAVIACRAILERERERTAAVSPPSLHLP